MVAGCSQSTFCAKEGIVVAADAGIVRMEKKEIYWFLKACFMQFSRSEHPTQDTSFSSGFRREKLHFLETYQPFLLCLRSF